MNFGFTSNGAGKSNLIGCNIFRFRGQVHAIAKRAAEGFGIRRKSTSEEWDRGQIGAD